MPQGFRPDRVADQMRAELTELLARQVHDPGIGFITITRVKVTGDLSVGRVYYSTMGNEAARKETRRALGRATPFLRRQIGSRLGLRRVPELEFVFDQSIEQQDRLERLFQEIHEADEARQPEAGIGEGLGVGDRGSGGGDRGSGGGDRGSGIGEEDPSSPARLTPAKNDDDRSS